MVTIASPGCSKADLRVSTKLGHTRRLALPNSNLRNICHACSHDRPNSKAWNSVRRGALCRVERIMVQMSTPTKALIASARRKSRTARELLATRATEDAESLYRRIASSRPGDKLLGLFAETIVHCVGDSHVRVYRHVRSRMSNVALTTTVVRGATAYGILNSMSNSGASQRIEYSVRNTPEGQPVLLQLGEVDCGSLLWRLGERRNVAPVALLETAQERYFRFVDDLDRHPMIISGVTPPTVDDYTLYQGDSNPRYGLTASWNARLQLARTWNSRVSAWCADEGHVYLDVLEPFLTTDGAAVRQALLPYSPSDHHLDSGQFADYLASTALPRALTDWTTLAEARS